MEREREGGRINTRDGERYRKSRARERDQERGKKEEIDWHRER